jgi:hypothetical protein
MSGRGATLLLVAANILVPIAILVFATGFFPYKPFLPGLAEFRATGPSGHGPPAAPFDRLVFMVIDALRRCVLGPLASFDCASHLTRKTATLSTSMALALNLLRS